MKELTENNKAVKKFRAKEHNLNRSRVEFYLTSSEKVALTEKLNQLRAVN